MTNLVIQLGQLLDCDSPAARADAIYAESSFRTHSAKASYTDKFYRSKTTNEINQQIDKSKSHLHNLAEAFSGIIWSR
jgi:hypothetical protein